VGPDPSRRDDSGDASLQLADWRRRVAELYGEVRERAATDPPAAWERWRAVREALYREHPQSPVPGPQRADFRAHHWPYDPALRFDVAVDAFASGDTPAVASPAILPVSAGAGLDFSRIGRVAIPFPGGARSLDLFWMAGYAGGLFLPFRDATNGHETYGAGRYLLDTAKGADLGGDTATGRLILDFNFAFQPSCAFDPRWACPLAPPENRLDLRVEAGERIA
jgi:uncharacterized protein (DUF1684 family)